MKQLNTIQKMEKLNDVFAIDEVGPGGAHHLYQVCKLNTGRISDQHFPYKTGKYACNNPDAVWRKKRS